MSTIVENITAASNTNGQRIGFPPEYVPDCVIDNRINSVGIEYSVNSGSSWVPIAAGSSAVVDFDPDFFRVRKASLSNFPIPVSFGWTPETEVRLYKDPITGALTAKGAGIDAAEAVGGVTNERFPELSLVRELRALLPTFGSSTADTTRSRSETGPVLYYDTVRGNDSNNGTTALLARRTVPQFLANGQHNSKIFIAAGSTIPLAGIPLTPVNNRCTITVYDGNPASSTFGQEILDQPNPFLRAQAGGWLSDAEIASKYFTIDNGFGETPLGALSLTTGAAINTGSCPNILIRGFVTTNGPTGIVVQGANANTIRLEDFAIRWAQTDPRTNNNRFGGCGIRVTGSAGASPNLSVARCFIEGVGEDVMHAVQASAVTGQITWSDFAVSHACVRQLYNAQHADFVQLGGRPGGVTIRRGVVHHAVQNAPLLTPNATTAIGGILVSTGTTGDTSGTGGLMEDVIMVSNIQHVLMERQPGFTLRRCIGIMSANNPNAALGITASVMLVNAFTGTIFEEDCIWAVNRPVGAGPGIRASISGGAAGTQTNVIDIPNYLG
jgi:hypothetical protein